MDVREGYKKSDIGVIPIDWRISELGEVLDGKPKYGVNAAAVPYDSNLPAYIRITDISDDGQFVKVNRASVIHVDYEKYLLQEGDIVFARTGASTGKSYLYNKNDGTLVYAGFLIRTKIDTGKAVPEFIKACVGTKRFWDWVKTTSTRSGQPGINGNEYASFLIPTPPLLEQQAIATALSDIDSLINSLTKLINKKKYIKRGAMQELLSPLEGWVSITLGKSALLKARIGWQGLTTAEYKDFGEIILVTGTDFKNGFVDWENCHYVDRERYIQDKNIQLKVNDVLVTKDGTIGKVAFVNELPKEATLNSGVFVIRPISDSFVPEFFYYVLLSKVFDDFLNQLCAGSTISHLYQKDFVDFIFSAPVNLEEQRRIARLLSDMDSEIKILENKLDKYKNIKQGMMQELLTGRIRLLGEVAQ